MPARFCVAKLGYLTCALSRTSLTALGTACSPEANLRAYNVRDWKGERSENTLAWSEAEAVALKSPTDACGGNAQNIAIIWKKVEVL